MFRRLTVIAVLLGYIFVPHTTIAQITDPTIMSSKVNTASETGKFSDSTIGAIVSLILADVQRVRYDATNVYIESTGVPSHKVGPFDDENPATPSSSPIHPPTPLAAIGMFVNGVPMYNMSDTTSYEDEEYWNSNAIIVRVDGFDSGYGHPSPNTMMGMREKDGLTAQTKEEAYPHRTISGSSKHFAH